MGASMKDVARLANVSTATVSHVINKTRNVNEETKAKVIKAIKDLNYCINPVARALRTGSSKTIGYVVSNLVNYFYMDIALHIDSVLSQQGYHLLFINSNEDHKKERENIESLALQNVDGLIIAPVGDDCSYMQDVIGDRYPCVFFDRKPKGFERDCIMSTNEEGAYEGTEFILREGHKKIGFVSARRDGTIEERIGGYRAALQAHGVLLEGDNIQSGRGTPRPMKELKKGEVYSLTQYLVEKVGVTSLVCGDTLASFGAISYLKDKNIRVPEDFALVCFDDPFWLSLTSPFVTFINQDNGSIGKHAANALLNRIKKEQGPFKEYRIPTKLVCPPSS